MDPEKRARRQSLRIIVSECFMVLAVVITVAILALVVSGYWVNSDFKIERQGMLQISSVPTGADVIVDGETAWNQRTNTSKVLASGEHTIELKKDGYDSWSRKINVFEGLLYRIHYPRLFLLEREKQNVYDMSSVSLATVSPNREQIVLANNTTEWQVIDLTEDNLTPKNIDVSGIFTSVSMAPGATKGLFNGSILDIDWSSNNERLLIKASVDSRYEWVVIDIKNPSESANLTKLFNSDFSKVSITNHSASNFLAEIIISAKSQPDEESELQYYVGLLNNHNEKPEVIKRTKAMPLVALSRFYDNKYITVLEEKQLEVFEKNSRATYLSGTISNDVSDLTVGHAGEFQTAISGNNIAVVDMEAKAIVEWFTESSFGWLDPDMIYTVKDGELIVYDYDGLNRRSLANNVSSHFPVTITSDKWLYYVSDNQLVREKIMD